MSNTNESATLNPYHIPERIEFADLYQIDIAGILKRTKIISIKIKNFNLLEFEDFIRSLGHLYTNSEQFTPHQSFYEDSSYCAKICANGLLGSGALPWHIDMLASGLKILPARAIYAKALNKHKDENTMFVDIESVYMSLPKSLRELLCNKCGTYSYDRVENWNTQRKILQTNPLTNKKSFLIDRAFLSSIDGVSKSDFNNLIDTYFDYVDNSSCRYIHKWNVGDLVLFDNNFLLHRRPPIDITSPRTLLRLSFDLWMD
jgi:hypothetical protein